LRAALGLAKVRDAVAILTAARELRRV